MRLPKNGARGLRRAFYYLTSIFQNDGKTALGFFVLIDLFPKREGQIVSGECCEVSLMQHRCKEAEPSRVWHILD